jgi:hypothetical protein
VAELAVLRLADVIVDEDPDEMYEVGVRSVAAADDEDDDTDSSVTAAPDELEFVAEVEPSTCGYHA